MVKTAHEESTKTPASTLFVATELSKGTWKLGLTASWVKKARIRDVDARDLDGFLAEIRAANEQLGLADHTPVKSSYEAGRDDFWIHRFLIANGIDNVIVDL